MSTARPLARKITLQLTVDDFRRLESHLARTGQSKQEFVADAVKPLLDLLRITEQQRSVG